MFRHIKSFDESIYKKIQKVEGFLNLSIHLKIVYIYKFNKKINKYYYWKY